MFVDWPCYMCFRKIVYHMAKLYVENVCIFPVLRVQTRAVLIDMIQLKLDDIFLLM